MSAPAVGERVRVRAVWPPGHVRTPGYVRGRSGVVVQVRGPYPDPELLAYGRSGARRWLCTVRFRHRDLWPGYAGDQRDSLQVDLYEQWLDREN
jgi:nitrile hydratase